MTGQTPKYGIKYPTGADKVKNIPTTMQEAATTTEAAITAGVNEMANKVLSISEGDKSAKPFDYAVYFKKNTASFNGNLFATYQRGFVNILAHLSHDYGTSSSTPPANSRILLVEMTDEKVERAIFSNDSMLIPCVARTKGGKDNLTGKVCIMLETNKIYLYTLESLLLTGITDIYMNFTYLVKNAWQK